MLKDKTKEKKTILKKRQQKHDFTRVSLPNL